MKIFLIYLLTQLLLVNCNEENIKKCAESQEGKVRLLMDELTALNEWQDINDGGTENFLLTKPCLVRQYLASKNLFNTDTNKWNMQAIVDNFGDDSYNYCRFELERKNVAGCAFAFKGAKCLLKANRNVCETRINLINCIYELGANNEQLIEYSKFPEKEKIPCLFKCFADKMKLYKPDFNWNIYNWERAFGPMKHNYQDIAVCKTSLERIKNDDECDWMYDEQMCLERLNYDYQDNDCKGKLSSSSSSSSTRSIDVQQSIKNAFFARL